MLVMKRSLIFLMLALAMTLTSCDFMRKMSGRPTKEELNTLKAEIERKQSKMLELYTVENKINI